MSNFTVKAMRFFFRAFSVDYRSSSSMPQNPERARAPTPIAAAPLFACTMGLARPTPFKAPMMKTMIPLSSNLVVESMAGREPR